jgi:hypothetical protein
MEPRYLGCYGVLKGRRFVAILFSFLLVWAQLSAAPALPACAKQPTHACCHRGGKMSCCSTPSSGSQPLPAVPSNAGAQKQFSIFAPTIVAGALPEYRAELICSASRLTLMRTGAPLYARDCAWLI